MSGDATCDNNPGTLVSGAKGDRVFNLQKSLTKLGLNPGNIDGIFGGKPKLQLSNSKQVKDYK